MATATQATKKAASKSKKSERTPREVELRSVIDVPAKERTPQQKLERKLLHALYHKRTAKTPEAKAEFTKTAAALERKIKALNKPTEDKAGE